MRWLQAGWGLVGLAVACGESRSHDYGDRAPSSGGDTGSGAGGGSSAAGDKGGGAAAGHGGTDAGEAGSAGSSLGRGGTTAGGGSGQSAGGGSAGRAAGSAGAERGGSSGSAGSSGSSGAAGAAELPLLIELSVYGYDRGSRVRALSADGTYVAGEAEDLTGVHGVRWRDALPTVFLTLDGWDGVRGTAISGDGSVVGGSVSIDPFYYAFAWRGASVELLPGFGNSSQVRAVSGDGSVLVGTAYNTNNEDFPARWTGNTIEALSVPEDFTSATPVGVSYAGDVIAGSGTTKSQYGGVRWQAGETLGLDELGLQLSDVSDDGAWLVGRLAKGSAGVATDAVHYGADGVESLPAPDDHQEWLCEATAVNGDGSIIVGSCTSFDDGKTSFHPFLWNARRGSVTLDTVLAELGIDGSVYESWELADISSDGTTLLANCVKNGVDVGVRVRIDSAFP